MLKLDLMKVLFIGAKQEKVVHGWDQVNLRNQIVLENVLDTVTYLPLETGTLSSKIFIGVTKKHLETVDQELSKGYDYVFVCQSTCGRVCKYIKKHYPNVKIITFFHNIERHYAGQYLKVSGVKAIPYYMRAYVFEKMAAKYSDYCITLNERDSQLLEKFYEKKASAIMPTSLEDKFLPEHEVTTVEDEIIDYLFVGTAFYPNVEGIQWFIDNVMPKVGGKLTIIGKDMKSSILKNLTDRIKVYGFVDDLSDYYRRAKVIVGPIFHGGGMKTKTAEALMYGKLIVASKESLEGYTLDVDTIKECNTAEEYISTLNALSSTNKTYYQESHDNFVRYCSYDASEKILRSMLFKSCGLR